MSAINIFQMPTAVHVITDGATYRSDGTLHAVAQKAHPIAHLRMIVAARGPSILTPLIAESIQQGFTSFDDAIEGLGAVIEEAVDTFERVLEMCSVGSGFDLLLAGWSEERDCGETWYLSSFDRPEAPAWTVTKCGPVVISPNDDAMEARLKQRGAASLDLSRNDPLDVALVILEEQRKVKGDQGGDEPVHGVGCFAQVTSVTRDGISSRILRRWPDAIGVPLQPVPATHDEYGELEPWYGKFGDVAEPPRPAAPAMSRQQRRNLERMNRKLARAG